MDAKPGREWVIAGAMEGTAQEGVAGGGLHGVAPAAERTQGARLCTRPRSRPGSARVATGRGGRVFADYGPPVWNGG